MKACCKRASFDFAHWRKIASITVIYSPVELPSLSFSSTFSWLICCANARSASKLRGLPLRLMRLSPFVKPPLPVGFAILNLFHLALQDRPPQLHQTL